MVSGEEIVRELSLMSRFLIRRNRSTTPRGIQKRHENVKKRNYEARICEVMHVM